jgi:hypothetical protein
MIGVDQVNIQIPETVREGCAVPVLVHTEAVAQSQAVPISIRKGGGQCVDPPSPGYGLITWEKTIESGTGPPTDTLTVSLRASPGKKAPKPPQYREGAFGGIERKYLPPLCPLPGYTNLDSGLINAQTPGADPVPATTTVVDGESVYRALLPSGTIRSGTFKVAAAGGADVPPFETAVQIGPGINVTTPLPTGTVLRSSQPITVRWSGGDPNLWVTLRVVTHGGHHNYDWWVSRQTQASSGEVTIPTRSFPPRILPIFPGPADIYIELTPDPADEPAISVPGLSLGGRHTWKHTYHFGGLTIY